MSVNSDSSFEQEWQDAMKFFESKFGEGLDIDSILFLIGMQELGHGVREFSKDEKMDVMHIAVCSLLEPYGYWEYQGRDEQGWPHFERKKKLPFLKGAEQDRLMKEAIVTYTRKEELSEYLYKPPTE